MKMRIEGLRLWLFVRLIVSLVFVIPAFGQIPEPGPVRSVNIPEVKESRLKNGFTIAVVERPGVPIVTARLLLPIGSSSETIKMAGLANLTAQMLTKGTKSRTAEQISEEMEFLGGSINSGAGWNNTAVTINVTSDKLEQAMSILADVVMNPSFPNSELELLKSQIADELKYNLTQPGFLANYAASVYSYGEHPAGGTGASIESFTRENTARFYSETFGPQNAVLIFTGDITVAKAASIAENLFGKWSAKEKPAGNGSGASEFASGKKAIVSRLLVIDLPNSGQASVNFFKRIDGIGRGSKEYYPASVLNSLLGGGYSSRLNQEIRIKRGLSYGAGSSFAWKRGSVNFGTRTQTKNESAAEVAELVIGELRRLAETTPTAVELDPRKMVLTGGFGRNIETTNGLAFAVSDLFTFGVPRNVLNAYMPSVNGVSEAQVRDFADKFINGGDMIIVGDYSIFKNDLAKRFPNISIDVVKASELDIESPTLRKGDVQ